MSETFVGDEIATEMSRQADLIIKLEGENKRLKRIANYVGGSPSPVPWDELQQKYIDQIDQLEFRINQLRDDVKSIFTNCEDALEFDDNERKAAAKSRILRATNTR